MNIHKNARLTPLRREEMALAVIEGGLSKARVARIYGGLAAIILQPWLAQGGILERAFTSSSLLAGRLAFEDKEQGRFLGFVVALT